MAGSRSNPANSRFAPATRWRRSAPNSTPFAAREAECAEEMARVYGESGVTARSAHRGRRPRRPRGAAARSGDAGGRARAPPIPPNFPTRSSARPACGPPLPPHLADLDDRPERFDACCRTTPRAVARFRPRPREGRGLSVRVTTLPSGLRVVTDADARICGPPRSASSSAPARATSATRSTACRICSNIWRSRARGRRNAREIAEEIENVGGDLNAETSVEQTAYFAHVLERGRAASRSTCSPTSLTDSQFDAERTRAREERHPAGDRRGRGHARRSRLRSLHRRRLAGPADRPADPRHARGASAAFDRGAIDAYLQRSLSRRRDRRRRRGRGRPRRARRARAKRVRRPLGAERRRPPSAGALSRRREF